METRVQRTAMFLKEIYINCHDDYVIFSMRGILKKYHVSFKISDAMLNIGILKRNHIKAHRHSYKWMVGEPNLAMAEKVLGKADEYEKAYHKSRKINILDGSGKENKKIIELEKRIFDIEQIVHNGKVKKSWHFPKIRFRSPILINNS